MSGKVPPRAAFCEEYDEDADAILPDTRRVANVAAKRSKPDLRSAVAEPLLDVASDSGYSSRTAATVNSTQSGPSGQKSPVPPLKLDTATKRADLDRVRSIRKERQREKEKERIVRAPREDKMQVGSYPGVSHHHVPVPPRSPSRSRRRESSQMRHYPGTCWECDNGLYHGHSSSSMEPRAMDYSSYYMSQPSTPSIPDYALPPPSPHSQRYAGSVIQDVHVSRSSRPHGRGSRSSSYHTGSNRPVSFHGGMMPNMGNMGNMMYNPSHLARYEHGPPLSSSAYANSPSYAPPPPPPHYYQQPAPPYPYPEYNPSPDHHHQERSVSRPRDSGRSRRMSSYGRPVVDYDPTAYDDESESEEDEDEVLEPTPPPPPPVPQGRSRRPSHTPHDEDFYRMPPPPLKHKATPHIIQKRPELQHKPATSSSLSSERRSSAGRSMDLSDMRDALPMPGDFDGYRRSSRDTVVPERRSSLRDATRRSQSYHDSARPTRAIESSSSRRRRAPTVYHDDGDDGDEIEDKSLRAEEYQASRSGKSAPPVPAPLTDALLKAKTSPRDESDSGSQKSRSNSSRGSDARTHSGSGGTVAKAAPEEDKNIVMTMNGVTMSFTQESVGGKRINVRAGDTGALALSIEGKRPKKYLTGGSDYTGSVARREIEDARRPRGDRRSDKASRRSSRSTYSGRF